MSILLRARLGQWFGMTLVAGVGYVVYELTADGFGAETAAVLSSFAIGLSGMPCAFRIVFLFSIKAGFIKNGRLLL